MVTQVWRHIPCPCPELPRQGSGKIYNSTAFVHFRLLVLDRVQATSKYASFTEAEGPGETKEDF